MIGCAGVGLHSGARVGLTLCPAAENSGIRFRRVDRLGSAPIAASLDNVRGSDPATSLGHPAGGVRMIGHLMAAFAACEIDNVLVEISGPELPVMDGSALPFVLLMECAGAVEQAAPAAVLELVRPLSVSSADGSATLEPARVFELVVETNRGQRPFAFRFSSDGCKNELIAARDECCRAGDDDRFADEAARHSVLDALADLALVPARLQARYVQTGTDPHLRRQLLRQLVADPRTWRLAAGTWAGGSTAPQALAC